MDLEGYVLIKTLQLWTIWKAEQLYFYYLPPIKTIFTYINTLRQTQPILISDVNIKLKKQTTEWFEILWQAIKVLVGWNGPDRVDALGPLKIIRPPSNSGNRTKRLMSGKLMATIPSGNTSSKIKHDLLIIKQLTN